MNYYLEFPKNFHFKRTVNSHGWRSLAPFEFDETNGNLKYVFSGKPLKTPVAANIGEEGGKIKIEISGGHISSAAQTKILRDVRHILRFDDDLKAFYKLTKQEKEFDWIAKNNAGRLLRSPTVFEDLVKTICTTNCSWALTKKMVNNLVEKLGEVSDGGKCGFPTAEKMAEMPPDFYRSEIRAGYRAPYFAELAEKVAAGKLNPENWLDTDLPTRELKKQMKQIKGVGDYAAENLLKLVGRYDGLALDSWLRAQFYKQRNASLICGDQEIENFYSQFGEWKGLAIWCDLSK
ncbi:MAG: endonuclease III domain-containing protein [Pyrinomonadaceae bacterium]